MAARYGPRPHPQKRIRPPCRSIPRPSAASPRSPASGWRTPSSRTLQAELNGILGWIEQLNEVNVDGVEPLTGAAQMALKMREDVVTDGGYPDKVLANAPERVGDFFAVPEGGRMRLTDLTIAAARDGLRAQGDSPRAN